MPGPRLCCSAGLRRRTTQAHREGGTWVPSTHAHKTPACLGSAWGRVDLGPHEEPPPNNGAPVGARGSVACPHVSCSRGPGPSPRDTGARTLSQVHRKAPGHSSSPVPTYLWGQHPPDTLPSPGSGIYDPGCPDLFPNTTPKELTRGLGGLWGRARPGHSPQKVSGWAPIPS